MKTEETVFNKTLGLIISNMISVGYNGFMEMTFREANSNYLANKCREAAKAEQILLDKLKISDKVVKGMIEERVNFYSNIIFDLLELDEVNQKRVSGLVNKLKEEERKSNQS